MSAISKVRPGPLDIHVDGLGFPEGPVVLPDGTIAFVDLVDQKIRIHDGQETRVLATVAGSPNGMRLGPDGALYVANNGGIGPRSLEVLWRAEPEITGRIQRIHLDGKVTDHAIDLPGPQPWRPNDLVFAPSGEVVFTDPTNWEVLPDEDRYLVGRVNIVRPDGRVDALAEVPGFPNGLAFGPDNALYVAQTIYHQILRFPWDGREVGPPEVWCKLADSVNPDGMAWVGDRLLVAGSVGDEVDLISLSGAVLTRVSTGRGSDPTNLAVQDDRVWVTLGIPGQLVSLSLGAFEP
jgi:sugar lactone lactonase YvrE